MKQTAVEWLIEHLTEIHPEAFEQAKQMEKEQIIEAHGNKKRNSSGVTNYEYTYTGEDYYNDTFKPQ